MAFEPLFSGMWRFGAAGTDVEPVPGTWNWNELALTVTEIRMSNQDKDLIDRGAALFAVQPGDRIHLRNTSTADNWVIFDVLTNTETATGELFEVTIPPEIGTVPGLPAFRQVVLFDFLRPVLDTAGPISGRYDEIVARVAGKLHRPDDDVEVVEAVDAAIIHVIYETGRAELGLPDDAVTVNGIVGFAQRIYLDAFAPNGALGAVGDSTFETVFTPEDIYRHWHGYFDRLNTPAGTAFGVA